MEKYENKDLCKACGGKCCKKSGCDYSPKDFSDLGINNLLQILAEGKISIVSALSVERLPNNKLYMRPILYLRARNTNRPIVDLFSTKTTCSQLTDIGCSYTYEERPSGGKNLIPSSSGCYPAISQLEIVQGWESYQKVLSKLVKRITGNTVEEQLRIDVEKVFYDILTYNFEGVMEVEIRDITSIMPSLAEAFPQEYLKVYNETRGKVKTKKLN